MILTDTHIHLYGEDFNEDRDELLREAFNQDIQRFFLPSIDSTCTAAMYELEAKFPENIFLMAGLHPTHVKENFEEELAHIEAQLAERKFCAVGETGIDLYWDRSTLSIQKEAFRRQIKMAKKHKLPIVIHCRNAFDEIFEVLEKESHEELFGIFHCFTGTLEQAKTALSYNMKLGIGGVVTFKNGKIDKFLNRISLEHLVLETDGPYLAPAPYRGKRNKPVYLRIIAEKLAEIYETSLENVATVTTRNSKEIFGI